MRAFIQEFKSFIARGNVMDLAVGVIIGGAFKGVVHGRLEGAADCFTDICSDICKNALDRVPDPRKEGSNITKHVFNIRVCFREFCVKP